MPTAKERYCKAEDLLSTKDSRQTLKKETPGRWGQGVVGGRGGGGGKELFEGTGGTAQSVVVVVVVVLLVVTSLSPVERAKSLVGTCPSCPHNAAVAT